MGVGFLHPLLLAAGVAAVSIPILIHFLMRRRRKPIAWGAMRFLVEAYRRQHRRLQLEQLILLLLRCLAVLLLAAAIARPIATGFSASDAPGVHYLLIDNSIASTARGDDGTALERLLGEARAWLETLDPERDRVGLVTLAAPASAVVADPSADLGAIRRLLEAIEPTDAKADLPGAMALLADRVSTIAGEGTPVEVAVFSEFLRGSVDLEATLAPLAEEGRVRVTATRPREAPAGNVAITEMRPARRVVAGVGDLAAGVRVELVRSGSAVEAAQATTVRVVRAAESAEAWGETTVRWSAGQERASAIVTPSRQVEPGEPGEIALRASIDRDEIDADGVRYATITFTRELRVGVLFRPETGARGVGRFTPGDWVRAALSPLADSGDIDVTTIAPASLDRPRLAGLDALVIASPGALAPTQVDAVAQFLNDGGLVVVVPGAQTGAHPWADGFESAMSPSWSISPEDRAIEGGAGLALGPAAGALLGRIAPESEFLLPAVSVERVLPVRAEDATVVLRATTGEPVMLLDDGSGRGDGAGVLVQLLVSLDPAWTNLPAKPFFVPMMQETVREGVSLAKPASVRTAGAVSPEREGRWTRREVSGENGAERVPEAWRRAGAWRVYDAEDRPRGLVAVNPDVAGSRADATPAEDVQRWLAGAGTAGAVAWIGERQEGGAIAAIAGAGDPAAFAVLLAALAVLVLETIAARAFTHGGEA